MSVDQHLSELQRRHQDLDRQLADALAHPSTDDAQLTVLKRKKLLLKDEIARLSDQSIH